VARHTEQHLTPSTPPSATRHNTQTAYIALGSNLGNRLENLQKAVSLLSEPGGGTFVSAESIVLETEPVGCPPGSARFYNSVVAVQTTRSPQSLLARIASIESLMGRSRGVTNAPRTLDLDILLLGDLVLNESDLIVPHPRLHVRRFVLEPLCSIAASVMHPVLKRTMRQLLAELV
jgi:2-amino-4-hydroxy-6-hydroxymethyldihydropteridine diphosphokinase